MQCTPLRTRVRPRPRRVQDPQRPLSRASRRSGSSILGHARLRRVESRVIRPSMRERRRYPHIAVPREPAGVRKVGRKGPLPGPRSRNAMVERLVASSSFAITMTRTFLRHSRQGNLEEARRAPPRSCPVGRYPRGGEGVEPEPADAEARLRRRVSREKPAREVHAVENRDRPSNLGSSCARTAGWPRSPVSAP